jgi:hypothetical protein
MWLVIVDTMQIQPYIFGSNRLRENVGASYLVGAATGDWAFDAVRQVAPRNNIGPGNRLIDGAWIEHGDLDAEVLYAGGGNFVVLFGGDDERAKELARQFTARLSQHVLLVAPGLQLAIADQQMNWYEEALRDKRNEVFHLLDVQKRTHARSAPLLGLSVTAACRSTGLPATDLVPGIGGEPPYLASDEILAKVDVATRHGRALSQADRRLQEVIGLPEGYSYPADFDDMGATPGEYSHIAIVHADGNGVGQRIHEICNRHRKVEQNRDLVLALRHFSLNLALAGQQALKVVLDSLKKAIDKGGGTSIVYEPNKEMSIKIDLVKSKEDGYYLPFRPIVFGGDDVTFVCDGRLGLSLATMYLREFEKRTAAAKPGEDGGLTACAGVAIVKSHYPFARAYELAEELSKAAKAYRKAEGIAGSCLDWHFALSGLGGSITDIRDREYKVRAGDLALRPVTLKANPKHSQCAWPVVAAGIDAFQREEWVGRRNKIKALRDSLREGTDAVKHFRVTFNNRQLLPPVLPGMDEWLLTGWQGDRCGYFDAIELVDWFIPLEGEADATPANKPAS